ncbi:MAG: methionine--tRNA ligase [Candidatus Pacebacteria bacterium]|nr:methionine--tRNA ligase [Candidatus Paceibacterota bacterium]
MASKEHFYITTTLPYVNSDPHIGFAAEIVHADILARYARLMGHEVFFNTGTDEHGLKVYTKAKEEGIDTQKYVDEKARNFENLKATLNLSFGSFIRTTESGQKKAAQEFWNACDKAGDIYKKAYKVKYCVGCELEKTESELVNGRCPIHPNLELEIIEEENYFFRFSKYEEALIALYEANPEFVVPATRLHEIKTFVERGLEDFSISRLKSKMPWGVDVPGDSEHVMYVWFDALVNYIDVIGWPKDEKSFEKWWPGIQIAGKDNLRQQSAMWQAMLLSAGLPNSKQIIIRGFINSGGQKMSKSLGNVISPISLVNEYGADAVRYFLAREVNPFEDSDVTLERIKEAYNANLANGLGNLTSRILKMAQTNLEKPVEIPENTIPEVFKQALEKYDIKAAADYVWKEIAVLDSIIQEEEPFKLIKTNKAEAVTIIEDLCVRLYTIGRMLNPILPETSEKIKSAVKANKMPEVSLFPRKE